MISSLKNKTDSKKHREEIIDKLLGAIDSIIIRTGISREKLLGIGMSVSGIIDTKSGYSVFCPNISGLNDFPLKKFMEKKTGLPVFIDDSVRCMAVAEKNYGIAKDYDNFIFVSVGKGIGIGAYIDGKIYRGSMGLAGELGHITVSEDGPVCNCGNKGCLEAIASGPGIIRRAKEGIERGIITSITSAIEGNLGRLTVEIISKAADEGDKFAYYLINRTGEYIGIAIAATLNLFGSDLVVLGGGIPGCGEIIISAIKRTVKMRALQAVSKRVRIIKTDLGDKIAALGAATNMIEFLFSDYSENILNKSLEKALSR